MLVNYYSQSGRFDTTAEVIGKVMAGRWEDVLVGMAVCEGIALTIDILSVIGVLDEDKLTLNKFCEGFKLVKGYDL